MKLTCHLVQKDPSNGVFTKMKVLGECWNIANYIVVLIIAIVIILRLSIDLLLHFPHRLQQHHQSRVLILLIGKEKVLDSPSDRVAWETMTRIQDVRILSFSADGQEQLPFVSIVVKWMLTGDSLKDESICSSHKCESSRDRSSMTRPC